MMLFKHLQVQITIRGSIVGSFILKLNNIIHAIIKLIYKYLIK